MSSYAAHTRTANSWGSDIGSNRANCGDWGSLGTCGDQWEYTAPVGSFQPNASGLHDMYGNVYELVEDCWNTSYAGAPTDSSAWLRGYCGQRVVRGRSWDRSPREMRSANRFWSLPGYRDNNDDGFRVARTLTP